MPRKRHSCIVLGAGLAGLAAALRLHEKGWHVTIVEARNRIGGRVFSHHFSEDPSLVCELGGEWIGTDHGEMLRLVKDFGLHKIGHRYSYSFWGSKPQRSVPPGAGALSRKGNIRFNQLKKEFLKLNIYQQKELDKLDWWSKLDEFGLHLKDLLRRDLMDSTDFGESIRQVSAYVGASEYFGSSGIGANKTDEMDYKVVGGNDKLVYALADAIGQKNIHKNFHVRKVHQGPNGVEVSSPKGTLKAELCICALPAHQLPRIDWGKVDLPQDQRDAARELQYARITKTAVLCRKRFWPKPKKGGFSVFTSLASDFCFDSTFKQEGDRKKGNFGILCSYSIGDKADDISSVPKQKLGNWIVSDVARVMGFEGVDHTSGRVAVNVERQPWQDDPLTRGAYAFYRPGQWFTIRPILQRPHRKVLFAGEHIAEEQGFMEGAVVTGRDAADSL